MPQFFCLIKSNFYSFARGLILVPKSIALPFYSLNWLELLYNKKKITIMFTSATITQAELKSTIVRNPLMVTPETTVRDAIAQMSGLRTVCSTSTTIDQQLEQLHINARSSCVLIVENQQILGILTERDMVRLSTKKLSLDSLLIGDVMISPVITLKESAFTDFFSVVNLLQQHKIRHLPMVNDQNQIVGLLTNESLLQTPHPADLLRLRQVSEVMTNDVIYAFPYFSMLEIAKLMATHRIGSVVIVQAKEQNQESLLIPMGIITERDLVQFQALNLNLETCQVDSVMSTPIFAVSETDSLWTVQEIMEQRFIQRLVVTGQKGQLLGIVTGTNILKAIHPLELYKLAEVLEQTVLRLEAEKRALLENRNSELEQQVEERTAILKAKAEQEKLITTIASQIRSSLNLQEILNTTVQEVRSLLNCDRAVIWQLQPDYSVIVVAEATTGQYVFDLGTQVIDPCFKDWVSFYQQGRILVVADIYTAQMSDCHRQFLENLYIRSQILVPIIQGENLWGLLSVSENDFPRLWQNEEVNLLQHLATQVAIALQQATAYEQIQTELQERRKVELALIDSQNRYINLTANAPVGIFRTDKEGNCVFVNKCWCDITGFTLEDALGKGWIKSLHPEDRDKIAHDWYQAVREHRSLVLEYRYQRPDGVITWVLAKAILEHLNGEIIGYVGTITDITEGKQANEIVKNLIAGTSTVTGRDFFPALAQHIINAFQLNRIVITEMRNGIFCKLVDLSHDQDQVNSDKEDLAQLENQSDLSLTLHNPAGEDLGYIAMWSKNFTRSSNLGQIINILQVFAARTEAEIERLKATEELQKRNYELRQTQAALEDLNQSLESMVREQTKEVFKVNILQKAILDGTDYSIISTDVNGIIQTFNAGAEKMLGYSAKEVIGKTTPQLFHDRTEVTKQAQILSQELNRPMEPGFEVFVAPCRKGIINEQEWTYIRQDGSRFPVLLSVTALHDSQGTIIGYLGIGKDITDHKQAEIQLQKLSDRLALALKSGAIGYWEWDLISNTIAWDERMYQLYGYDHLQPDSSVVYDIWSSGLHPDDRQATETLLHQAVLGQAEYDTEFRVVHPDGSIHFIQAYGKVVRDNQDQIHSMIGVNFDITKSKQIEENIKTERARLQLALEAANMGSWSYNISTGQLNWSDRTQEIFGFVPGTFTGNITTFISMVHPEYRDIITQLIAHNITSGQSSNLEYPIIRPDGEIRWLSSWFMISHNLPKGKKEMVGVVTDITDRKQAEIERQKLLQELSAFKLGLDEAAIVAITDTKGVMTYVNDRFCYISGYSRDQLIGNTHRLVNSGYHPRSFFQDMWRTIGQGKIWRGEICNRTKNGGVYWVDSTIVPFLDSEGRPFQYLAVRFDITARKLAELAQKRLLVAMDAAVDGIAILEGDSYIYLNQSHVQLFGYEQPEDLLGKSWQILYATAEIKRFEQEVFPILGRDGFWQGEAIATRQDGSTFDEELSLTVTDEGLLICVCRNITQRKQAEKALQSSETRLRQMFNSSVVGMILADFQGNIIDANDHFLQMVGYNRTELETGAIRWDTITPSEYVTADQLAIEHLMQYGFINPWEKEYYRKDGSLVSILLGAAMMPESDNQTICVVVDISERKIAEQENQRLKERLQFVLSANPAVIFTCRPDSDYGTTFISDNIYSITGYTPEEFLSDSSFWIRHIHPADVLHISAELSQLFKQGYHSHEYRFLCQDFTVRWIRNELRLIRDAQGHPIEIVGYFADITDMKQIQAELAKSEAQFRTLVEGANDVIWSLGIDGCYTYLSPQFETIFGWKPNEWIGQSFVEMIPPDDLEIVNQQYQKHILLGDKIHNLECRYLHRNGDYMWVRVSASAIKNEEGRVIGSQGILSDISDLKQAEIALQSSENRFRRVFSSNIVGMMFTDFTGQIVDANDRFLDIIGYTREELNNHEINWAEITPPEHKANDDKVIEHLTLYGAIDPWEKEYYRKDGSRVPVLIGIALLDNVQNDSSCVCVILDIRELKRAEQIIFQQADREKILREITQKMRESLDLETIFHTACQEIRRMILADRVGIFKFNPESNFDDGEFVAESVLDAFSSVMNIRVHDHCFGENYASLYTQGKYYVANDIYNSGLADCHIDILAQFQIRANLVMPLLYGDKLWGLLCIHQCDMPRYWQQSEIDLIQQIANQLAIAIKQANLYEQIQTELQVRQKAERRIALQLQRQQALANIIQKIRESLDINDILAKVTEQVKDILKCDRVIVFQLFPDGRSRIVEEIVSPPFPTLKNHQWLDEIWSEEILNFYWQGIPRIVPDVMNDIWTDCLVEYNFQGQIQSKIVAPILLEVNPNENHRWISPGQICKLWGILVVHSCEGLRVWNESEAELLQQIANQLAIAIQQASLFEQLQQELMAKQLTQQKLTETNEQLALSNEQLARATRLKDEFLANMSHELRTPLNAILGMSEALQEEVFGTLDEKQHQALQTIESSGSHLLTLINDILDVAKIESGKIELHRIPTSINQLCESSLVFIKQQSLQKRIQIHTDIPYYLPDLVIDEIRIRQVLINLLNNAIKFTPEGGRVSLKVSIKSTPATTETDLPTNYISFAITDNGIGITPENLAKLFQPFVQIDSALNRQYAGTGLGLTLVKRIVEMHGGKVEVNSKIGVGSCFVFLIPCEDLLLQVPKTPSPQSSNLDLDQKPTNQGSEDLPLILLAEDNEANILTISRYLKAKGYQIILAKNGQEAIDQAKSNSVDLILMDIQMPGMDGIEAIKLLRQDSDRTIANIPIIALTALAMTGDRERCLEAGANEYLTKPVKLNQLTSTIQEILAKGKKQ